MIEFELDKRLKGSYGDFDLKVSGRVENGVIATLLGESGAGKTSILRMLAGLMPPDKGYLRVNGKTWIDTTKRIFLKPQQRRVGYVFQDFALFPNMTVRENLRFAFDRHEPRPEIFLQNLLETTELTQLQHRKPDTLSGGQQQRVALARALARRPDLLLLDEPLSALDAAMRQKLQNYILALHAQYRPTVFLVSHDWQEIMKMSKLVFWLNNGTFSEPAKPSEILMQAGLERVVTLTGTVVSVQLDGLFYSLQLQVGDRQICLQITEVEAQRIKPAQMVTITAQVLDFQ